MFADSSSSGPIFGKNPSTYSRRDARRARKRGGPSAESCVRCLLLFSRTTRTGGTLDIHLLPFLRGENVPVVATDNVGLGMARAAAVLNALSGDARLSHLMFLPYSAGQVVLRGDRLSDGADR